MILPRNTFNAFLVSEMLNNLRNLEGKLTLSKPDNDYLKRSFSVL